VNQTSRTTYSSSSAQLVDELNFQFKFDESIVESNYEL